MKMEDLNKKCPFGARSTKHYSIEGKAPNIHEANLANRAINQALLVFTQQLELSPKFYTPLPASTYDEWTKESTEDFAHYPKGLSEVVPISNERSAEHVLRTLEEMFDPFVDAILRLHGELFKIDPSHVRVTRETMHILQKNFTYIFNSPPGIRPAIIDSLARNIAENKPAVVPGLRHDPDSGAGVQIDDKLQKALVMYQSLQERFEAESEIDAVNKLLEDRPDIIESILGIQAEICKKISDLRATVPAMENYSVAFSEIAHFSQGNFDVKPSPRFLKIIIHNWGKYFSDLPATTTKEMLGSAITRALADEVYRQNIFIFRKTGGMLNLDGIAPKVCPARTIVGRMVAHYL